MDANIVDRPRAPVIVAALSGLAIGSAAVFYDNRQIKLTSAGSSESIEMVTNPARFSDRHGPDEGLMGMGLGWGIRSLANIPYRDINPKGRKRIKGILNRLRSSQLRRWALLQETLLSLKTEAAKERPDERIIADAREQIKNIEYEMLVARLRAQRAVTAVLRGQGR